MNFAVIARVQVVLVDGIEKTALSNYMRKLTNE